MKKDWAASVRTRLLAIAKSQGVDFNQILVRFALGLNEISRGDHKM